MRRICSTASRKGKCLRGSEILIGNLFRYQEQIIFSIETTNSISFKLSWVEWRNSDLWIRFLFFFTFIQKMPVCMLKTAGPCYELKHSWRIGQNCFKSWIRTEQKNEYAGTPNENISSLRNRKRVVCTEVCGVFASDQQSPALAELLQKSWYRN